MCVPLCGSLHMGSNNPRREHWISTLELESQLAVSCLVQVLGSKLRASARAVGTSDS